MYAFFLAVANLLGVFDFAFEGTIKARNDNATKSLSIVSGIVSTYGGGIVRDLVLLHVMPSFFYVGNEFIIALMVILFADSIYNNCLHFACLKLPVVQIFFSVADILGVIAFAISGVEHAVVLNAAYPIVVLSGLSSCVVGGCIRLRLNGKTVKEILTYSPIYRVYAFMISLLYYTYRGQTDNVYVLIVIAIFVGVFIREDVRIIMVKLHRKAVYLLSEHNNFGALISSKTAWIEYDEKHTFNESFLRQLSHKAFVSPPMRRFVIYRPQFKVL